MSREQGSRAIIKNGQWLGPCVLASMLALGACTRSDLRPDYVKEPSATIPAHADSPLVEYANRVSSNHGDNSGLVLLSDSMDALLARVVLADRAKYSIDLQYYLFHSDATGKLLAQHLIAAADRGVRVRILLDDLHMAGKDDVLRALDGHPGIDIRLFNPFHERTGSMWGMGKQFAGDFSRLNRRMHNKSFIVDSALAVVGGRNIGDEYFDVAGDVNFRDLDVLVVGPVIAQITRSFDTYWNSTPSVPIAAFRHDSTKPTEFSAIREALAKNAREIGQTEYANRAIARIGDVSRQDTTEKWDWGETTFVADDPDKVNPDVDPHDLHLTPRIREWLDGAQHRIVLVSPYFVPGDKGVAYLQQRRAAHVEVSVLTNSLSSTDADNVYAAYATYRPPLLASGVLMYELKPDAARRSTSSAGIGLSASSLHAKVMIVDDDRSFVGSMNLDPRSASLNTEDGVLVTSETLAKKLNDLFKLGTAPEVTYRVLLKPDGKNVYWETTADGKAVLYDDAPQTSSWRRLKASMTRLFPIEGLL
ncbi:MAG TPA: phospholipase D family protein [Rhodanobacteraceae bacterium]|nr:phospholipase D family protein [Rhodanobacteraceae bacterium]